MSKKTTLQRVFKQRHFPILLEARQLIWMFTVANLKKTKNPFSTLASGTVNF